MASSVQIYDDSESVSVSDLAVYSLDINDILAGGTITTTPTTETITPNADVNVKVSVTVDSPNTVDITLAGANEVSIAEVASLGPTGATGATGPSGIGVFNDLIGNPFKHLNDNTGMNVEIPRFQLELTGTLFAPVVSSSKMEISGQGLQDLFIVKLQDSAESKFVINLQGVTILGEFQTAPDPVQGGMFYSASGDFYLGN